MYNVHVANFLLIIPPIALIFFVDFTFYHNHYYINLISDHHEKKVAYIEEKYIVTENISVYLPVLWICQFFEDRFQILDMHLNPLNPGSGRWIINVF